MQNEPKAQLSWDKKPESVIHSYDVFYACVGVMLATLLSTLIIWKEDKHLANLSFWYWCLQYVKGMRKTTKISKIIRIMADIWTVNFPNWVWES